MLISTSNEILYNFVTTCKHAFGAYWYFQGWRKNKAVISQMPSSVPVVAGGDSDKITCSSPDPAVNKPSPAQSNSSTENNTDHAAATYIETSPVLAPSSPLTLPITASPNTANESGGSNGNGKTKKVWDA